MDVARSPEETPTLVYFQRAFDQSRLVTYVQLHYLQQIKCLSQFFRVHVVNEDCDFDQVCDAYRPDVALFDSGIASEGYRRLSIKNTSTHPEVFKLGFYNADSFCRARAAFLSDMDRWGIDTVFSISTRAAEYLPDLPADLFFWPNFIDPEIYRDYRYPKTIPVLFTGSTSSYYPWRRGVQQVVSSAYPSLLSPHLGYDRQQEERLVWGEAYARLLNAAWLVPSCGTVVKDVVRKHFEIPGSRACLVSEESEGLKAAGFADMQNCVLANAGDVLDKIDHLFRNQDQLWSIIDAGYELTHSCHTLKQRDQMLQWLQLKRRLQPEQRIVQDNPFGPLRVASRLHEATPSTPGLESVDRRLLQQARTALWDGRYDDATHLFMECLNTIVEIPMPEPQLGIALCHLFKGQSADALAWLARPLECVLVTNDSRDPDPVEWAYFMVALLCHGELRKAGECAKQFRWLRHEELDRARWLVDVCNSGTGDPPDPGVQPPRRRSSVHQMPVVGIEEWTDRVGDMLRACGRGAMADQLASSLTPV